MPARPPSLKPRKTPVQARSAVTVDAIFEATIQVLLDGGLERLTTTRVAERAGVSVGTLYQYFPNKEALLAGALERHLLTVVEAVEAACGTCRQQPIEAMAASVVRAFMAAKMQNPAASKALYGVACDVTGSAVVMRLAQRSQLALCELLATAPDARFDNLALVSFMLASALVGPVQGMLELNMPPAFAAEIETHLIAMASAYLQRMAV